MLLLFSFFSLVVSSFSLTGNLLIALINLPQAPRIGCISAGLLRMYEYTVIPFYGPKKGAHFHLATRASPNIVYFCSHGTDT
jgi:hypothetical protein